MSQSFVKKHALPLDKLAVKLTLANGNSAHAKVLCSWAVNIQSCNSNVDDFVLELNQGFDAILGQNWVAANGVNILYMQHCCDVPQQQLLVDLHIDCCIIQNTM